MKICLLAESMKNPVLGAALSLLAQRHSVVVHDPKPPTVAGVSRLPVELQDVDVYLLKSRSVEARRLAGLAEREGALVLNSARATSLALNRAAMSRMLRDHGVPIPKTWSFGSITELAAAMAADGSELPESLVVKSRVSRRGDLVRLVRGRPDVQALLPEWGSEPVIVQEFAPNDGFDFKFWVIGDQISVARRPGALEVRDTEQDIWIDPATLPAQWLRIVRRCGAALGLELFGVDLLVTAGRPVIVDVNAFPGFRGAPEAAAALADLVERRESEYRLCA